MQVLDDAAQISQTYDGLLARAHSEVLVFNRPPYAVPADWVNPIVLEALQRGVKARVLYQREQWYDPALGGFRAAMATYHRAGVQARLVDELPVKLAIVDRQAVLVALADGDEADGDTFTALYVDHRGHAGLQADAFEHWWAEAEPLLDEPSVDVGRIDGAGTTEPTS